MSWQLWQLYASRTVHPSKIKHARAFYLTVWLWGQYEQSISSRILLIIVNRLCSLSEWGLKACIKFASFFLRRKKVKQFCSKIGFLIQPSCSVLWFVRPPNKSRNTSVKWSGHQYNKTLFAVTMMMPLQIDTVSNLAFWSCLANKLEHWHNV